MTDETGGGSPPRADADATSPEDIDPRAEYVENVLRLDEGIEKAVYKLTGDGRIKSPEIEQARAKWANTLCKLLRERRMTLESLERSELAERVEALEEQLQEASRERVRA